MQKAKGIVKTVTYRYFFIFVFLLFSFVFYKQLDGKIASEIYEAQVELSDYKSKKEQLTENNKELVLQINSKDDPNWVEMVLMRELGLVADGKIKVHFTK